MCLFASALAVVSVALDGYVIYLLVTFGVEGVERLRDLIKSSFSMGWCGALGFRSVEAWFNADSMPEGALPAPQTQCGRPPPFPPTAGMTAWIIFPAWICLANLSVTVATSDTDS